MERHKCLMYQVTLYPNRSTWPTLLQECTTRSLFIDSLWCWGRVAFDASGRRQRAIGCTHFASSPCYCLDHHACMTMTSRNRLHQGMPSLAFGDGLRGRPQQLPEQSALNAGGTTCGECSLTPQARNLSRAASQACGVIRTEQPRPDNKSQIVGGWRENDSCLMRKSRAAGVSCCLGAVWTASKCL